MNQLGPTEMKGGLEAPSRKRFDWSRRGPLISVVIPAFNEELRIGSSLEQIFLYFEIRRLLFEVVVVDDGSTDGTARIVEQCDQIPLCCCRVHLLRNSTNRGKGFSVRRGMLEAVGRYGLLTDTDLSTPIEEFAKLEREVIEGPFDIAFGSRDVEGSRVEVRQSGLRESCGKLFNVMVRSLTGLPFLDTQCGFKLFAMEACREIFRKQRIERFGFDVELLIIARRMGLAMKEVPVVWRHDEGSKVRFLQDGSRMLYDLLVIRINELCGRYGARRQDREVGK